MQRAAEAAAAAAARAAAAEVRGVVAGLAAQMRPLREAVERLEAVWDTADHAAPEETRPTEPGGGE